MKYHQNVKIKNINSQKVSLAFHDIKLVEFLTSLQPIKIISWLGITDGKTAYFQLWFLGWKNFKVKHENYKINSNGLSFIDRGIELPLGIKTWIHEHAVKKDGKDTIIEDSLYFSHSNIYIGYILFPLLIFPIFIRRILYQIYFLKK